MNKERIKKALGAYLGSKKDLMSILSSTLVKIESSLSTIDISDVKSQSKYHGLLSRKKFAVELLTHFGNFDNCIAVQQEYISHLEGINLDQEAVFNASPVNQGLARLSLAKTLVGVGMTDSEIAYCMNLKRNV